MYDVFLILEAGAADELTHDGGGRYLLVGDGQEEVDELQQAVGLGVLRAVSGHRGEDYLRMGAQHGELDVKG